MVKVVIDGSAVGCCEMRNWRLRNFVQSKDSSRGLHNASRQHVSVSIASAETDCSLMSVKQRSSGRLLRYSSMLKEWSLMVSDLSLVINEGGAGSTKRRKGAQGIGGI